MSKITKELYEILKLRAIHEFDSEVQSLSRKGIYWEYDKDTLEITKIDEEEALNNPDYIPCYKLPNITTIIRD